MNPKLLIRIVPILYEGLPEPPRFLASCSSIVKEIHQNPTLRRYGVRPIFDEDLSQFSPYLTKGAIPPKNLRYNAMDGWLTVSGKIRWQLHLLQTTEPVEPNRPTRFPGLPENDVILGIVPLSIQTTPQIWSTESHFGPSASLWGSHLKIIHYIYHVRLVDEKGRTIGEEFKPVDEQGIAHSVIEHIAEDYLGIPDLQMEEIKFEFGYSIEGKPDREDTFERLRVQFYGSSGCSQKALKRSILLFDDIHFYDRPSYGFANWGTIGAGSPIRKYVHAFAQEGIPVLVHKPAIPFLDANLADTIAFELEDPQFSNLLYQSLKSDPGFRSLFVQEQANYGVADGREVFKAMTKLDLGGKSYDLNKFLKRSVNLFNPHDADSLEATFVQFLIEASVHVSLCCALSCEYDLIPFTEHSAYEELLTLRYGRGLDTKASLTNKAALSNLSHLAFKVLHLTVPDEALDSASFTDVIEYRKAMAQPYQCFRKCLVRLNTEIESKPWDDNFEEEIQKVIIQEVVPLADEFKNQLQTIWEKMFGDMAKGILSSAGWTGISSLAMSLFSGLSWAEIFTLGASLATKNIGPTLVDYRLEKRNIQRNNALAYLLKFPRGNARRGT